LAVGAEQTRLCQDPIITTLVIITTVAIGMTRLLRRHGLGASRRGKIARCPRLSPGLPPNHHDHHQTIITVTIFFFFIIIIITNTIINSR
jgi:hypothetical protein